MPSSLGLFNRVVKATANFGGAGYSNYDAQEFATCPLCHKPNVRMQGNQTLDQHIERDGFTICPASGKAIFQANKLRFNESFTLVDEDLTEEDEDPS